MLDAKLTPAQLLRAGLEVRQDGVERSLFEWLRFPQVSWEALSALAPELGGFATDVAERLVCDARYATYVERQEAQVLALSRDEHIPLPAVLHFSLVRGLSRVIFTRGTVHRPPTHK